MTLFIFITLLLLGVLVGFINLVSAGGSLITLPTLIFLGLPPTVANGTNRIGILIQNFLGMYQFYKKGLINWKLNFILAIPAVIGSIIGAQYAIELSDDAFNNVLAIVMIVLLILIFLKPQKYLKIDNSSWLVKNKMIILSIVFIFIGFYGGFIQAGVGFLIIIFLTLLNKEMLLVEMHSVKTVVVTIYLLISTFVFIYNGQINWSYALVLSIGSGIGGWIGGRFAVNVSEKFLQTVLAVIVIALTLYLIFVK